MKNLIKHTWLVIAMLALASCAKENTPAEPEDPHNGKELIELSQQGGALTRAALTKDGFAGTTKVVIRMKAFDGTSSYRYTQAIATASAETSANDDCNTEFGLEGKHSHLSYETTYYRYWDDAFGRATQLTVFAVAVPEKNDNTLADDILDANGTAQTMVSPVDDAHWYTITGEENTKIDWSVHTAQTLATRQSEDIVYSNNIRSNEGENKGRYHQAWNTGTSSWDKSMQLGRLSWQEQTSGSTTGKFDQGHLVFKHALSWITIVLKEYEDIPAENKYGGFDNEDQSDFKWTKNKAAASQNITLKGFPTSGKLDIASGVWSDKVENVDITQMHEEVTTNTNAAKTIRTLHAYVLPGTTLYENTDNVIEFEIDNAKYYVKGSQIAQAIRDYYNATTGPGKNDPHAATYRSFETTEAGKHYFINLSVAKKAIDNITAAIIDWETVNSTDADPKNTYCTFQFEDRTTRLVDTDASKFSIYRAAKTASDYITGTTTPNYDWASGYGSAATKEWHADSDGTDSVDDSHWSTNWFWENNLTYYHFRAAGSTEGTAAVITPATNDYFSIKAGAISGSDYRDYLWGAPFTFKDNAYKIKYTSANGFNNNVTISDASVPQISKAIGATESQINMLLFHMTSQIYVNIKTTTDESEVVLYEAAPEKKTTVEILNFLPDGTVLMGTGKVSAGGTRDTDEPMTYGTYTAKVGSTPAHVNGFSFGMVPQPLTYSEGTIGLRITTPDGNQYVIRDISTCYGEVSNENLSIPYTTSKTELAKTYYKIDEWYPNYKYTYTITIKKTGIQNITAAVIDWEEVTGDLGTIDLEN